MSSSVQITPFCQQRLTSLGQSPIIQQAARNSPQYQFKKFVRNETINIQWIDTHVNNLNADYVHLSTLEKLNVSPKSEYIGLLLLRTLLSVITLGIAYLIWKITVTKYQNKQLEQGLKSKNIDQVVHAIEMGASSKLIFDRLSKLDSQFITKLAEKGVCYSPTEKEWNAPFIPKDTLNKMEVLAWANYTKDAQKKLIGRLNISLYATYLAYQDALQISDSASPETHGDAHR